jgi:hypothetical protein
MSPAIGCHYSFGKRHGHLLDRFLHKSHRLNRYRFVPKSTNTPVIVVKKFEHIAPSFSQVFRRTYWLRQIVFNSIE